MKVGMDLDGVLDRPAMAALLKVLLEAGVEVHIITGIFDEAGEWQSEKSKREKLARIGIPTDIDTVTFIASCRMSAGTAAYDTFGTPVVTYRSPAAPGAPRVHFLHAVDPSFGLDYRLRDLGLRKGELSERLGLDLMIDDSQLYCDVMRVMNGGLTVLQVR
jgi:hypothetical protein